MSTRAIEEFWVWFVAQRRAIEESEGEGEICDQLLEELKKIHEDLYYEVSLDAPDFELVVTVEGRRELFELVEAIVGMAPEIAGWRFTALKPPMGFDFEPKYEGVVIDVRKLWFLPLLKESDPAMVGLRIGFAGYIAEKGSLIQSAVLMILDTALGERAAAEDIHYVEVGSLPEDPEAEGYIELHELPQYIEWSKKRRSA